MAVPYSDVLSLFTMEGPPYDFLDGSAVDRLCVLEMRHLFTCYNLLTERVLHDLTIERFDRVSSLAQSHGSGAKAAVAESHVVAVILSHVLSLRGSVFARRGYRNDRLYPQFVKKRDVEHWRKYLRLALTDLTLVDMVGHGDAKALLADPWPISRWRRYETLLHLLSRFEHALKNSRPTLAGLDRSVDPDMLLSLYRKAKEVVVNVRAGDASFNSARSGTVM